MKLTARHYKRLCLIVDAATIVALAVVCMWLFSRTGRSHYDVDRAQFPVKGVDISAHNGSVDFDSLVADTVDFVYIKATEGVDFCDAGFNLNYWKAREAGLRTGAYHFFRFNSPPDLQLEHFLYSINGRRFHMPLAVDVERWGNPHQYDVTKVKAALREFVDGLKKRNYPIVIYTNKNDYRKFIEGDFDDVPVWICSLSGEPKTTDWKLWQHSHAGKTPAVKGSIDLNTFNGNRTEFEAFADTFSIDEPPMP